MPESLNSFLINLSSMSKKTRTGSENSPAARGVMENDKLE